jgi:hypothetical protein
MATKISIDSGAGQVITVAVEHLVILDNAGKNTVLAIKTETAVIPVAFFSGLLATPEEVKARPALPAVKPTVQ